MDRLIVAYPDGTEIRAMLFSSYDFEVGEDDNSFEIVIRRNEFEDIPEGARIYLPGTEYGGIFKRIKTDTSIETTTIGGMTWRGMMQKKIIEPAAGEDYALVSGELNAIIKAKVEAEFPGLFVGVSESTGVNVTNYKFDRYCTLEEGLRKMLKSKGYRLNLEYDQTQKAVVVSAAQIVDYSDTIELSSDMRLDYKMTSQRDGVNHLICLGQGELRDRTVYHLYVGQDGTIGTTQYYTGSDEVAEIYDYAGAELNDLITSGTKRLEEHMSRNTFDMSVEQFADVAIGDIVGGRDYLSGMLMTSPVTGKIVSWNHGFQNVEYKLADEVTASA